MLTFGALSFVTPAILLGLAALPVLWWLLRVSPPSPRRVVFPALRLLLGITTREETPDRMPWWLLALRLAAVSVLIIALAGPIWNGERDSGQDGPLVLVVDTGWAAAPAWERRRLVLGDALAAASRQRRDVVIVPTAPPHPAVLTVQRPEEARRAADRLSPAPFAPDRAGLIDRVDALRDTLVSGWGDGNADVLWLSDGFDYGAAESFARSLAALGPVRVMSEPPAQLPLALGAPSLNGDAIEVTVIRGAGTMDGVREGLVTALAQDGRVLGSGAFRFERDAPEATATLALPLDIRNRIARFELTDPSLGRSAAGVWLLDGRWRRRPVGMVSGAGTDANRPLLSDLYYLRRALAPYTDVREGSVSQVLDGGVAALVLSDVGRIVGPDQARVGAWVEAGGVLIRFAGPRLAARGDDLIPVPLRRGGRALGGALSWDTPQKLAPFDEKSPFAGLAIRDEIIVERQVLAEPSADLDSRTWARLEDGTPLVTATRRGEGWLVLIHVTANQDWSNLPLSGLYVEMLRRLIDLAAGMPGSAGAGSAVAPRVPVRLLNGFGELGPPPPEARPLDPSAMDAAPDFAHPPGLYGQDGAELAYNLAPAPLAFRALPDLGPGVRVGAFEEDRAFDLKGPLLVLTVLLLLADMIGTLVLTGEGARLIGRGGPTGGGTSGSGASLAGTLAALALQVLLALGGADRACAQETSGAASDGDGTSVTLTRTSHLAYVITGDGPSDAIARQGLEALSRVLTARTAFEPGRPVGITLGRDPLVFHPLLYWRVSAAQPDLTPQALRALDDYMKNGGTVFFDTADQADGIVGAEAAGMATPRGRMRRILNALDLPPLGPVPTGHVLRKAFYLLKEFPGRYAGGTVWVAARDGGDAASPLASAPTRHDGVSPIIVGSHDWAGAWARDRSGTPVAAAVPGGERQRELAYRFGINLVMYTLSGNYKADQVHVPAILERLSQ